MYLSTPPSPAASDDAAVLLESLTTPDRFGELFERHHAVVFRYVRSRLGASADDLVGDTFVEAFRLRQRCAIEPGGTCVPWLLGIATNMVRRRRDLERRWLRGEIHGPTPAPDDELSMVERADASVLEPDIARALAALNQRDRDALLVHAVGELTVEETAAALGIPLGTAKSRIHRAKRLMAANLERHR